MYGKLREYGEDGRRLGSHVYFLCCEGETDGTVYIKIGVANDPVKRLRSLWTNCILPAVTFGYVKVSGKVLALKIERQLHDEFVAWRHGGEWFKFALSERERFSELRRKVLDRHRNFAYAMEITVLDALEMKRQCEQNVLRRFFKRKELPDYCRDENP